MTTIPYGKLQHCPTETDEAVTKWQIPQTKGHDLANVIIKSFYVYLIQSWPFLSPWAAATSRSHNPRHPLPARLFLTDPFRNSEGYLNRSGRVLKSAFSGFLFRLPLYYIVSSSLSCLLPLRSPLPLRSLRRLLEFSSESSLQSAFPGPD